MHRISEPAATNSTETRQDRNKDIIPNTAVFGPTNFIETIASTTTTARLKFSDDEDF